MCHYRHTHLHTRKPPPLPDVSNRSPKSVQVFLGPNRVPLFLISSKRFTSPTCGPSDKYVQSSVEKLDEGIGHDFSSLWASIMWRGSALETSPVLLSLSDPNGVQRSSVRCLTLSLGT